MAAILKGEIARYAQLDGPSLGKWHTLRFQEEPGGGAEPGEGADGDEVHQEVPGRDPAEAGRPPGGRGQAGQGRGRRRGREHQRRQPCQGGLDDPALSQAQLKKVTIEAMVSNDHVTKQDRSISAILETVITKSPYLLYIDVATYF